MAEEDQKNVARTATPQGEAKPEADQKSEEAPKVNRELLEATINVIRQSLQADGGDLVLVDCDDKGVVTLEMQGACAGCPLSTYDMSEGIERILKEHVPGVTRVQPAVF